MTSSESKEKQVIIIGCGIFGLSTAYWMLKKGGYRVTLLDKNPQVPAPDAASSGELSMQAGDVSVKLIISMLSIVNRYQQGR
jgi:glycine/D-amino acid oxidase-like deaminating enzyme